MAYVYVHIRKDNNQPFYIGVGGLLSFDNYQRANAVNWKGLRSRSEFWHNTSSKYGFIVDIVLDKCTKEEAFLEEQRLISLYGREDLQTGILVNHTNGGDGRVGSSKEINKKCGAKNIGRTLTQEHKDKISKGNKGKKLSEEDKVKKSLAAKGKNKNYRNNTSKYVINIVTGEKFDTCKKAAESINMKPCTLSAMLNNRNRNKTNFKYL
jgi:hypothetical protein